MRILLLLTLLLSACASRSENTTLQVAPGEYGAAFDAAREALLDCRFDLERVDANAGVITTAPKHTAGLLTPWDQEQSTLRDELEDAANDQRRIVRVEFRSAQRPDDDPAAPATPIDLAPSPAESESPLTATIRVIVERRHLPGRQLEPESIRRSSGYYDLNLTARGMQPVYYVPVGDDPELASRLIEMIRRDWTRADLPESPVAESIRRFWRDRYPYLR